MSRPLTPPVDFAVVTFPTGSRPLSGALSTELASLHEAELIRLVELVLVERRPDGELLEHDLDDIGDLRSTAGALGAVLDAGQRRRLLDAVPMDVIAVIVVWECTWAETFVSLARELGGQVVAGGLVHSGAADPG